jgi:hypothetical protein
VTSVNGGRHLESQFTTTFNEEEVGMQMSPQKYDYFTFATTRQSGAFHSKKNSKVKHTKNTSIKQTSKVLTKVQSKKNLRRASSKYNCSNAPYGSSSINGGKDLAADTKPSQF